MELNNQTKNIQIASDIIDARKFFKGCKGLLGRDHFELNKALWLKDYGVHTCFMKFNLDLIFVNKKMEVKALHTNVPPWRLVGPVWSAGYVFELAADQLNPDLVEVGDQLYVVS